MFFNFHNKSRFINFSCKLNLYLIGSISSFEFLFLGWLFASQKSGFSGFRYRFIPSLRFGTGYASPYNPCHCLKLKNSKLNLFTLLDTISSKKFQNKLKNL
ncbi:MAG: hypothetical protein MR739_13665 [Spirochaetia bacterium]|nr:hypothetical protein [Spirochaetia bacterium]